MLRPIWRSTAPNNQDQAESLRVKCEGSETSRLTKGLEQKLQVFINKKLRKQQGALKTNRAATDRARDKTTILGMGLPHTEGTRWTCSQEGTGVEPTGEAKERKTPAHLATY